MEEMPKEIAEQEAADEAEEKAEAIADNAVVMKEMTDMISGISDSINDIKSKVESVAVSSFSELPSVRDVIYTWHYNVIDEDAGKATTFTFKFHGIPQSEYKAIEKMIPMPVPDESPAVNQLTKEPILNDDGTFQMIKLVEDPNYIKQAEDARVYRTIALLEVSLGYEVPGKSWKEKYKWFLDEQGLALWQAMMNIVWVRLMGAGLVNFT